MPLSSVFPQIALLLSLIPHSGCGPATFSSNMPKQRVLPQAADPPPIGSFIDFASGDSVDYVVRDIDPVGEWRWTRDHPELKFRVEGKDNLRLALDFVISERTFKDTGPVTMTVKVNRVRVGVMRCDHAGEYHFETAVPAGVIAENGLTFVVAEANPVWVSPADGAHLGFLIKRAGFRK